ncbi:hypothetical protein [Liquorilactobacillus mali]|uniref:Peptidase S24/S26A/S26B/S26C domain-containing protein n=1 Tax=Liquorilactobacillus mali KCTC 3596 = DSM 20444 TaxID=1046596 RepID=J0L701_9LACO|nr:hypothetical protein [Liquorilactobacillus mali]EJF00803.1 hypothetical protein LMA_02568 [Liquorilactobacillus mali KCTC 3596 = DSM 20444]KRN09216.1 hypothetical protein FD00_GL001339 [Liquorilactobacillus mali KCTC 3596 = DSM 20444]MDC7952288.1 hypothetical protein [Liquorilactobacillus mali]MDV7757647.1 hypothetical protein [Liquorilactobacillus mali]QFQ74358.1 hypothetical protein LM596_04105 [Liquorilactobacillus mali]
MHNSDIVISINDEKYTNIELEYSALLTASDNPYLKNDDIICIAKLKKNKLDYIKEKDIVAFTSRDEGFLFHLYRVENLNKLEFQFHPLSDFLSKESFILKKADLEDSALIGKVLYTINRLNNALFINLSYDESPN